MAEPERTGGADPGDAGGYELPPGVKPISPEAYKGPGGCGFTGCMYVAMLFAALAVALLIFGLFFREWTVPVISPRN